VIPLFVGDDFPFGGSKMAYAVGGPMPDSKVVIAALGGIALLVAIALALARMLSHLALVIAVVVVSLLAILAMRRRNLRRYGL
jgi:hypothetical protein